MTTGEHTPVVRIARQSIVNRHRVLQAYELLFRGTVDEARGFDGTEASATSLVTAMLDIGWDQLRGGHSLYLNVDEGFLLSRLVRAHGIKVLFTGEGADEMFAGYDLFR